MCIRDRPKLIIYESVHLGRETEEECRMYLEGFGYETHLYELDTWCINPAGLDIEERAALVSVWRWLCDAEQRQRPLLITRAIRKTARSALRR